MPLLLFTRRQTLKYAIKQNNVVRRIGFRCHGKATTLAAARAALGANGRQTGGLQRRATWRIEPT